MESVEENAPESSAQDLSNSESFCKSDMKDDTPGIKGEVMFVSTDSNEQYNEFDEATYQHSTDITFDSQATEEIKVKEPEIDVNIDTSESELSVSMGSVSLTNEGQDLKEEYDTDYLHDPKWVAQDRHIFILSESGKPIYSRHGREEGLVTLFGLIQALVSYVADGDDVIRSVTAGDHRFVFLNRSPLVLLAVSHAGASCPQLLQQLHYVHGQVVSVLTASALTKVFERKRNYDFRHMLGGTERLLDNLIRLMGNNLSFLLGAVQPLPLSDTVRDGITQVIIKSCSKIKNLVFAVVICNMRLISLVRMNKFLLHPADLHLLFNLVNAMESLKTSENWMPICLPKFDPKGYLHAHVSYLTEDCEACLLLLSVDREQFFTLSEAKQKIVSRLRKHHHLEKINEALRNPEYDVGVIGTPELRHFVYKSRTTTQFTLPDYSSPYNCESSQQKLFKLYHLLHHRIHSPARPLKMHFMVTPSETMVGWVTKDFELYTTLEPLTLKSKAISVVNKILQWVKSEENKYFILSSPTF